MRALAKVSEGDQPRTAPDLRNPIGRRFPTDARDRPPLGRIRTERTDNYASGQLVYGVFQAQREYGLTGSEIRDKVAPSYPSTESYG